MVWSELALLGAGALVGQAGSLVQRRADRQDRREERQRAELNAREDRAEAQTRAAVLEVAYRLQEFSILASGRNGNASEADVEGMIGVFRQQGLLVADPDLRGRIELAKDCLEWRDALDDKLGAGIDYLTSYICSDLEPAIGAYLRGEPIPARSHAMDNCEAALLATWQSDGYC